MAAMRIFPAGFLFGTATAATQIEGGCTTSDWYEFAREPGRIKQGDTPDIACDSWNRWHEDVELQRSLSLNAYRLSLEWARVEPRPGEIDGPTLDTYRRMLGALRDAGIEPMVTLHHFSLPTWVAARGAVLANEFPALLARFASTAVAALGDLCRFWVTINEPNVLAANGYLLGIWPPARKRLREAMQVHYRLLEAHVAAYRAIKQARGDSALVGVAHHLRITDPLRAGAPGDHFAARAFARVFNDAFAIATCEGRMYGAIDALAQRGRGFLVSEARGTQDFFGLNYYSRDMVRLSLGHAAELFVARSVAPGAEVSDLGWEVYPEGLGILVRKWASRSGLPIYVTENGIADRSDEKRGPFLRKHLAELARALAEGVPVRGYFHWSLLDNFEWAEGYGPRFGLVEVDHTTQERRLRPSAALYARIARERRLPEEEATTAH
jgi:beta-glucosidase